MPVTPLLPRHAQALRDFRADFAAAGEDRIPAYFPAPDLAHGAIVERLHAWARGAQLEAGWSACTTAFLEVGDRLVGVVNVRHSLDAGLRLRGGHVGYSVRPSDRGRGHAKTLLRWALSQCASRGISEALLTTDPQNRASQGVIVACGGVLTDRLVHPDDGQVVLRYAVPTR